MPQLRLSAHALTKNFTLHAQGGLCIDAMPPLSFELHAGQCQVLLGPSGAGKSTLLKLLHGNYRLEGGSLTLHADSGSLDLATLPAHAWPRLRRDCIGYVSQFLRVVPRVSALEVVMEPLLERGVDPAEAHARAIAMLRRLNLPERLWSLAPGTFSGGEQQRVNIARGFIAELPILLLDEPTASLDAANREVVIELIEAAKASGAALLGIFHDEAVRERVADGYILLESRT
ncbi:phosphonate C-P lyase system protein PhnL [Pseudomonas schmalbachii]|uniref:Phosphonate C-P lyase system protein PhnL n=1 Tax=Pseudomonas schmalbachii TaxID=2816993 RepID=A0ABS3TQ76_9PSED|nr:phosphonate C-P lyase system protein PhnL [Pseudomonas schmalbachii]MBO3275815.1 phosphonate C-P lyase system protein PhnL [Pseudomonas schmalbachii]